jgi:hypothetical protein
MMLEHVAPTNDSLIQAELQERILDLEKFEEVVVGRELKMIALEKEIENLRRELNRVDREQGKWT